jgi:hypothetical protein
MSFIDLIFYRCYVEFMNKVLEIQNQTVDLSIEEKEGLLAFLVNDVSPVIGADDDEVLRREAEMDSGEVKPISHDEFLAQVGRS